MEDDVEIEAALEDVLAEQLGLVEFGDRGFERTERVAVFVTDVEERALRLDRVARKHHSFEHLMRVLLHQDAVVVRARLRLIGVDREVDRAWTVLGNESPLQTAKETRAAAPAQAGVLDLRDDLLAFF